MKAYETEIFALALGLKSPWGIERIEFSNETRKLDIWIRYEGEKADCPVCGKGSDIRDRKKKSWRHLDFFQHECYLHCDVPRSNCEKDGVHQIGVPWSEPRSGFSLLFEAYAMVLVKEMPVNAAARILRITDTRLWRIVRKCVDRARANVSYEGVTALGMDETSEKSKHSYISLFADLTNRRVLFSTPGNSSSVVSAFVEDFKAHNGDPTAITTVCCDLWRGYTKGVKENLPQAKITYDRFHFVKKLNDAMDEVRRSESKENKSLKNCRYLFLKNPENLTDDEKESLKPLREDNGKTARAYSLKLALLDVYKYRDKAAAQAYLYMWCTWATRSRLDPFVTLSKSVRRNMDAITNWFDSHISNGFMEGINSVVQAAKNKARGFSNPYNFIAIVYLLAGKLQLHTI